MPIEKLNGIDIYYEVHGTGEPLLLIMGFGAQGNAWNYMVPGLSKEYQVITFDNRGTGESGRPNYPYSMKDFVDDIIALLDFLKIDSANICGVSMGGMISLQFVLAHPEKVKRLILLATTAVGGGVDLLVQYIARGEGAPIEVRAKATIQLLFNKEFQEKILNDEALWKEFLRPLQENPTTLQDYKNQAEAVRGHDVRARLSEIQKPTLIMVGTNDALLPPRNSRKIARGIPNSELVILRGLGHGFTTSAADELSKRILEFLRR